MFESTNHPPNTNPFTYKGHLFKSVSEYDSEKHTDVVFGSSQRLLYYTASAIPSECYDMWTDMSEYPIKVILCQKPTRWRAGRLNRETDLLVYWEHNAMCDERPNICTRFATEEDLLIAMVQYPHLFKNCIHHIG